MEPESTVVGSSGTLESLTDHGFLRVILAVKVRQESGYAVDYHVFIELARAADGKLAMVANDPFQSMERFACVLT